MEFELEPSTLHLIVLSITAIFILIADHDGFNYMRGKVATLSPKRVQFLHYAVWIGLVCMILTGALLLRDETDVLEEPVFYVKMLMVAALLVNGFFIGSLSKLSTLHPFAELTQKQKNTLLISGAVSGLCWVGAATIGYFFL